MSCLAKSPLLGTTLIIDAMARASTVGYKVKGNGDVCSTGSCRCHPFWKLHYIGILLEEELAENGKQQCDPDANCRCFAIDGSNPGNYQLFSGSHTRSNSCDGVAITWSSNLFLPEFTCYAKEAAATGTRKLTAAATPIGTRALLSRRLSSLDFVFIIVISGSIFCFFALGLAAVTCFIYLVWNYYGRRTFLRMHSPIGNKEEVDALWLEEGNAEDPGILEMRLAYLEMRLANLEQPVDKQRSAALNTMVTESTLRAEELAKLNQVGIAESVASSLTTKRSVEKATNFVADEEKEEVEARLLLAAPEKVAPQKYGAAEVWGAARQADKEEPTGTNKKSENAKKKHSDQEDLHREDVQHHEHITASTSLLDVAAESNAKGKNKIKKKHIEDAHQGDVQHEEDNTATTSLVDIATESNTKDKRKKKKHPVDQEDVQHEEEIAASTSLLDVSPESNAKEKKKKKKHLVDQEDVHQEDVQHEENTATTSLVDISTESNTKEKKAKKQRHPVDQEGVHQEDVQQQEEYTATTPVLDIASESNAKEKKKKKKHPIDQEDVQHNDEIAATTSVVELAEESHTKEKKKKKKMDADSVSTVTRI